MQIIYFLLCIIASSKTNFIKFDLSTDLVQFRLVTSDNQNGITVSSDNVTKYINNNYEVWVFIHGWNTSPKQSWYKNLTNAFFSRGKYNIVQVDWSGLAETLYAEAVARSPEVGQKVGDFILNLTKDGTPLKNIQVIGHSLGAQISGYVGNYIYQKTLQKLTRITGLDPAGPFFTKAPVSSYRLDANDAKVVFVIHSDDLAAGALADCGTTDVYLNGGGPQPGCPSPVPFIFNIPQTITCSHGRSHDVFIAAVKTPGSLTAASCPSYDDLSSGRCNQTKKIDLGGKITLADRGKYYLKTTSYPPFRSLIPLK